MKNIVIITSNSIRHNYFKIIFSQNKNINVLQTYVETNECLSLKEKSVNDGVDIDDILKQHFISRHNTEYDFFSDVIEFCTDKSNSKYINKGSINETSIVEEIIDLNPDLVITFGCSIIKPPLIEAFENKVINAHLGLSPYYFGSGTNFHCLVNNELQFEGYTLMYMDEGIDTGKVIHQSRATILPFDNPHQIGNRLIKDMTKDFVKLVVNFNLVENKESVTATEGHTYKIKDATNDKVAILYDNFSNDSVINYLKNKSFIDDIFPLIKQSFI